MSHIVGYTGQIRQDQLDSLKKTDPDYELSDTVGVWGLEKSMESELKGQKGLEKDVPQFCRFCHGGCIRNGSPGW